MTLVKRQNVVYSFFLIWFYEIFDRNFLSLNVLENRFFFRIYLSDGICKNTPQLFAGRSWNLEFVSVFEGINETNITWSFVKHNAYLRFGLSKTRGCEMISQFIEWHALISFV